MFTNRKASYITKDNVLIEAACLSTDTKPTTGVANGSALLEMDTSKVYAFNEAGAEWLEITAGGGGGGGGGSSLPTVKYSVDANLTSVTCDTSFENVTNYLGNGIPFLPFVFYDGNGTDAFVFPPNVTGSSLGVNYEVSLMGQSFTLTHTSDSITLTPAS